MNTSTLVLTHKLIELALILLSLSWMHRQKCKDYVGIIKSWTIFNYEHNIRLWFTSVCYSFFILDLSNRYLFEKCIQSFLFPVSIQALTYYRLGQSELLFQHWVRDLFPQFDCHFRQSFRFCAELNKISPIGSPPGQPICFYCPDIWHSINSRLISQKYKV